MPPYIEITHVERNSKAERKLPSLRFRIETKEPSEKGSIVTFGSKIFLVDWYFLTDAVKLGRI